MNWMCTRESPRPVSSASGAHVPRGAFRLVCLLALGLAVASSASLAGESQESLQPDEGVEAIGGCQVNGCGPGWGGYLVPEYIFAEACNRHDQCYMSCQMQKEDCDRRFLDDMRRACDARYPNERGQRAACKTAAYGYYRAVRTKIGWGTYQWAQRCCSRGPRSLGGLVPKAAVDSDGDWIADDLEVALGLDPSDPADATADLDGDGINTIVEVYLGLDPFAIDSDANGRDDLEEISDARRMKSGRRRGR